MRGIDGEPPRDIRARALAKKWRERMIARRP